MTKQVLNPIHLGVLGVGCLLGINHTCLPVIAQTAGTSAPPAKAVSTAAPSAFLPRLQGIVLVPGRDRVTPDGVRNVKGLEVRDVPMLADARVRERLAARLQPALAKAPFTSEDLSGLLKEIVAFCRESTDSQVFDVAVYDQDFPENVLQIAVIEAKVGSVTVENPGRKWVSDEKVLARLGLKQGEPISKERLKEGLEYFAQDGFVDVQPSLVAGQKLGTTDAAVRVDDRLPVAVSVGYQSYGSQLVGENQVYGRATVGNLFGVGHRFSYQYTGDVEFDFLKSHSVSYVVPLPRNQRLVAYGGYADVNSDTSKLVVSGQTPDYSGKAYGGGLQYSIGLSKTRKFKHEIWFGGDYKYANTTALFGNTQAGIDIPFDLVTWSLGYRFEAVDRLGTTRFDVHTTYGPGDWTSHSARADYDQVRQADPEFLYVAGTIDRFLRLLSAHRVTPSGGISDRDEDYLGFNLRVAGTWTDDRLPPSETFRLGGYDTVRGYDMALVAADKGFVVRGELRLPWVEWWPRKGSWSPELGIYGFCDHGYAAFNNYSLASDGKTPSYRMTSSGGGTRFRMGRHLTAVLEFGIVVADSAEEIVQNLPTTIRGASGNAKIHGMIEMSF